MNERELINFLKNNLEIQAMFFDRELYGDKQLRIRININGVKISETCVSLPISNVVEYGEE